jgi:hypothetical protein
MTTAVIGATGRVGSEIVRGVLARGDAVAALVRGPGKARCALGERHGLHIRATHLDDPRDLTEALDGIDHRDAAEAGLRVRHRIHGIETFNVLSGSEYFFLPSLSALRWLGRSTDTCRPISFATRLR